MAITGPLREVGKIYEMSGAAARTGNLKEKNVKNYIKKGGWEVVENNKAMGRRACMECNFYGIEDDKARRYVR